jgi:RNA polymerase sigma-70 factor (ECF subfamily)
MRLVCEHDETALAALYDRYAAQVNGLALSILHNPSLAEEATHDVFLRVWQQPTAYDPARGTFAGWLLRVARNRSIDLLRRRREDPIGALEVDDASWIADPAPGPEEQAMTRLHRQEVRRALDELAPDQRRLLELAYYTGLSHSQIADLLGRPLGTVKSQIRSAMLKLAERLGPPDHLSSTPTSQTLPSSGEST